MQSVALKSYESQLNTNPITAPWKSLGSKFTEAKGASDSLGAWREKARAYYNSVMSGETQKPSAQEWQQFLNYYSWAEQQLQGSSSQWGDSTGAESEFSDAGMDQEDPFQGIAGPQGNRIHNEEKAEIGFLGENDLRRDIWSNDINIDVAAASAKVTVEETMDTSLQPPEKVTKVIVEDRATHAKEVYFIHDFVKGTDHLKINVPNGVTVQDTTGNAEIGKYQTPSANGTDSESAVGNFPVEDVDGRKVVEPPLGTEEKIEFNSSSNSEGTYEFWGDYNLNLLPSDKVVVSQGNPEDPKGFTVEITHSNGKKTTVYTHEGFKGNINATPGKLTWTWGPSNLPGRPAGRGDAQTPDTPTSRFSHSVAGTEEIPAEFADSFTLNDDLEANGGESSDAVNPNEPLDTPASSVSRDGKTATYEDEDDITLTNYFDGKVETHEVIANGKLTLRPSKPSDRFDVKLVSDERGKYFVITTTKSGKTITYRVPADQISAINIDAAPGQVHFVDGFNDMAQLLKEKIQIGGESIGESLEVPESVQKLIDLTHDEARLFNAIRETYGSEVPTDEIKFREWLRENFNPPTMDEKLVKVLFMADPKLTAELNSSTKEGYPLANYVNFPNMQERLAKVLNKIFTNQEFTVHGIAPEVSIFSDDESISSFRIPMDANGEFSTNPDDFDFNE